MKIMRTSRQKVVSYTASKAEQARGGDIETTVSREVDHVSGGEVEDGDWDDVDEVRKKHEALSLRHDGAFRERLPNEWQAQGHRQSSSHPKATMKCVGEIEVARGLEDLDTSS